MSDTPFERLQRSIHIASYFHTLQETHIVLVGSGGLGSTLALSLAGSGIGKLTLVDGDSVSETNIPHCPLFLPAHIGQKKTDVITRFLGEKFPGLILSSVPLFVQQCPPERFTDAHLIICAPDNDTTRLYVNHFAVRAKTPCVYVGLGGSGAEWQGYTFVSVPGKACFNCFHHAGRSSGLTFEQVAPSDDMQLDRKRCGGDNEPVPTLAPVVGVVASLVSSLALKLCLRLPVPTYTSIDLLSLSLETVAIQANPTCIECGVKEEYPLTILE